MSSTVDQSTTSTVSVPGDLPGRAVDVVHAAARTAGVRITTLNLYFHDDAGDGLREILVHLEGRDVASAQRLLAALGAVAKVSDPYGAGQRQVNVDAPIPALGGLLVAVIATEGLPPQPNDPTELIADVDAARAAADRLAAEIEADRLAAAEASAAELSDHHVPRPWDDDPEEAAERQAAEDEAAFEAQMRAARVAELDVRRAADQAPTVAAFSRKAASVERAVRFRARFDSTCPACGEPLREGEPASWLDGEVVHDTCAEAAGIDVFDPR